jgi:hypothetical protein
MPGATVVHGSTCGVGSRSGIGGVSFLIRMLPVPFKLNQNRRHPVREHANLWGLLRLG